MENAQTRQILYTSLASAFLEPPRAELVEALMPVLTLTPTHLPDLTPRPPSLKGRGRVSPFSPLKGREGSGGKEHRWGDERGPETSLELARMGMKGEVGDDLQRAFTRLLVGPGSGYVPPYASVHLNGRPHEKPLLWGPEAVAVQAEYAAAGLTLAPGLPQVPDHLGIELQFLAYLYQREAEARQRGEADQAQHWRDRQQTFIRKHLLTWLPAFTARVEKAGAHPFYRSLLQFLEEFLENETA